MLEWLAIAAGLIVSDFLNGIQLFQLGPSIQPDFILIFIVYFALKKGGFAGVWIGFFGGILVDAEIGILKDVVAGYQSYIGLHSLPYALIGYVIGDLIRPLYRPTIYSSMLTVFASSLFARIAIYLLNIIFFQEDQTYRLLWVPIYTAVVAVIYFSVLSVLYKFENRQEYI